MTCSAFSLGSARSSVSSARSSAASRPRRRVPAIGRICACPRPSLTSASGDEPTTHAIAELAEVHVRRRIQQPERAIRLERIEIAAAREADRQHELIDVAGRDVLLACARHAGRIRAPRDSPPRGPSCACHAGPGTPPRSARIDLASQRRALRRGACVQQRSAPREVIEHEQRTRREIVRVGRVVAGVRRVGQALEIAHEVIARCADETAVQRERHRACRPGAARRQVRDASASSSSAWSRGRGSRCSPTRSPCASSRTSRQSPKPMNE